VTVKNGTIEEYLIGVDSWRVRRARFENLTVRNLISWNPDDFVSALRFTLSLDVVVRDSFFEFNPQYHKSGMHLAETEFTVDNIEFKNGGVGVDISGECDTVPKGSRGSVINSRFSGARFSGVLVQCTEYARVADNLFSGNEVGVTVDTHAPGTTTGVVVEENTITGGFRGVVFGGTDGSSILNNVIYGTAFGIHLDENAQCPDVPTPDCFYATDNLISGNEVTGNGLDLSHHPNALGNTWVDNICETWEGAEIPGCIAP